MYTEDDLTLPAEPEQERGRVRERMPEYMQQPGKYTLEDYYALPDECRAELIDGVFYEMLAPVSIHQLIGGEIYGALRAYIRSQKGQCIAAYAPLDVQLDMDAYTMVQPDVLVVCDRGKFQRGVVYGAPDFIVEVLSKSTRKKDCFLKFSKYKAAGVREYWLVDPDGHSITVYDLEHNSPPVLYGFDQAVSVHIFEDKCRIDFAEISNYIRFLEEQ